MAGNRPVDYEVVLHITGWCPGFSKSIKASVTAALTAGGFIEGHLQILSVSELPAPPSLVRQDQRAPALVGDIQERNRK